MLPRQWRNQRRCRSCAHGFLRREHRYGDAYQIASAIGPRFPRNFLLPLEEGNLLRVSGKNTEAEEQYRRVWQNGREGKYGSLHYEIAAVALGDLLRARKNIRLPRQPTNWSARLRAPIRNCYRKRIWEPARCMTSSRSGTWQ